MANIKLNTKCKMQKQRHQRGEEKKKKRRKGNKHIKNTSKIPAHPSSPSNHAPFILECLRLNKFTFLGYFHLFFVKRL